MSQIDMSELDESVDFVTNHYGMFDAYPAEVETSKQVLTWNQYWAVLIENNVSLCLKPT
jgi:hypothetical protein